MCVCVSSVAFSGFLSCSEYCSTYTFRKMTFTQRVVCMSTGPRTIFKLCTRQPPNPVSRVKNTLHYPNQVHAPTRTYLVNFDLNGVLTCVRPPEISTLCCACNRMWALKLSISVHLRGLFTIVHVHACSQHLGMQTHTEKIDKRIYKKVNNHSQKLRVQIHVTIASCCAVTYLTSASPGVFQQIQTCSLYE